MGIEKGQVAVGDFLKTFQKREDYRADLQDHINHLQSQLDGAKREIEADVTIDLNLAVSIHREAIRNGDPTKIEFTKAFVEHTYNGGKPDEFFSLEKNNKFINLKIDELIVPEIINTLSIYPLPCLMNLLTSGDMDALDKELSEERIIDVKAKVEMVIKPSVEEIKKPLKDKVNQILPPAAINLFNTSELWVESKNPKHEGMKFTTLDNLAVLLIGNNWNENNLMVAKSKFNQTILPKFTHEYGRDGGFGVLIPELGGKKLFYSKEVVGKLISFMQDYFQTRKTDSKITNDTISKWPYNKFENTKKKLKMSEHPKLRSYKIR